MPEEGFLDRTKGFFKKNLPFIGLGTAIFLIPPPFNVISQAGLGMLSGGYFAYKKADTDRTSLTNKLLATVLGGLIGTIATPLLVVVLEQLLVL